MLNHFFRKITAWLLALIILVFNVWLVYPLFQGEYTQYIQSIEVSYITMAKFITNFWPNLSWNPLWYLGYPLYLLYTPLLPFLEVITHIVFPVVSIARAYRLITAVGYCFVPVSLYFFVLQISKRKTAAFLAAVAFSVLPSVNYLLGEVRATGNSFAYAPWRLIILTLYGEGPHTLSQAFLLLAAAAYHRLLSQRTFVWSLITAGLVALVGLTNAVGFSALAILLLIIAFCEILVGEKGKEQARKWRISFKTAALTYGLIAFWYNFSFIKNFFGEGEGVLKNYLTLFPWGFVFLGLIFGVAYLALSWLKNKPLRIAILWLATGAFIIVAHYEWGIDYIPQALRLMTEVDMAAATLVGLLVVWLFDLIKVKNVVLKKSLTAVVLVMAVAAMGYFSREFLGFSAQGIKPYSHEMSQPGENLEQTAEYEISQWLKVNARSARVFVSGNYAFWLNYFTEVPQVRGALDQSVVHPWAKHAWYQIYHDKSADISIAWAKIINLKYLVVNTGSSRNVYKDYLFPDKFEGLLELVYEKHGDLIYEIPLRNSDLAKAVDTFSIDNLEIPRNAVDKKRINEYVDWLENARGLSFKYLNNDDYQITGDLREGEAVLVQMAYDPGWRAEISGQKIKVTEGPLGFIILTPQREGIVMIDLRHRSGFSQYLGYFITAGALLTVIYSGFQSFRRRGVVAEFEEENSSKPISKTPEVIDYDT